MEMNMKLQHEPFTSIKNGTKTIEMRLNDEKRSLLNIGDTIIFTDVETGEIIKAYVIALHHYSSFEDLYANFDKVKLGYKEDEEAKSSDMTKYYSPLEQAKYGVLGIEIKVV